MKVDDGGREERGETSAGELAESAPVDSWLSDSLNEVSSLPAIFFLDIDGDGFSGSADSGRTRTWTHGLGRTSRRRSLHATKLQKWYARCAWQSSHYRADTVDDNYPTSSSRIYKYAQSKLVCVSRERFFLQFQSTSRRTLKEQRGLQSKESKVSIFERAGFIKGILEKMAPTLIDSKL